MDLLIKALEVIIEDYKAGNCDAYHAMQRVMNLFEDSES